MRTDAISITCKLFHFMSHPKQLGNTLKDRYIPLQHGERGSFQQHHHKILGQLLIIFLSNAIPKAGCRRIFFVMVVSFYLGMLYPFVAISGIFLKKNMSLRFRIIARVAKVILFPLIWLDRRQQKSYKVPSSPFDDTNRELAQKIFQSIREKEPNQFTDTY